jgi:hypothetical protein
MMIRAGNCVVSAGNVYICVNTGLTASTVAPTSTAVTSYITGADNIYWLYMGPHTGASADLTDAPVYTIATVPAECSVRIDPYLNGVVDDKSFFLGGSTFAFAVGDGGGTNGIGTTSGGTYANGATVDFCTDAPIFALNRLQNAGAITYTGMSPTINGQRMWPFHSTGFDTATPAYAGNVNYSQVFDFTAKPRKVRRVRQQIQIKTFTGVWVPPQYSVWAPKNPNRYRLIIEGDSFTQSGASTNGTLQLGPRIGALLGCDDVWDVSRGNTGLVHAGGGSSGTTRIPSVIAAAPDILFYMGTEWDVPGTSALYTVAYMKAAYKSYFETLLASLPDLIILMCGGRQANQQTRLAMYDAIAEFNHPRVKYIDCYGDTGNSVQTIASQLGKGWYTGDGGAVGIAGTTAGNLNAIVGGAPSDQHPNVRGNEVLSWRAYHGIVGAMQTI